MILNAFALENDSLSDERAEYDAKLEKAQQALSDDLYEAYFDNNPSAIEEVNEALACQEDAFFERLRENYTQDGLALKNAYSKAVAVACDSIAAQADSLKQIDRMRSGWDV